MTLSLKYTYPSMILMQPNLSSSVKSSLDAVGTRASNASSSIEVNPAYNVVPEGYTGTFVTYFTLKADANSGHAIENVRCTIEVVAPASAG